MNINYQFLYKTIINFKTTTDEEEIAGKEYKIVIDPKVFREIERDLGYLEELREDVKTYLLELDTEKKKNKILKNKLELLENRDFDLLKEENDNLKKELNVQKITSSEIILEGLEEKNDEIIELKRKLSNYSSIINSKNKKIEKIENKNEKLERNILKLKNNKVAKSTVNEVQENEIKPTYKSFIINKISKKNCKLEKHYDLNIDSQVKIQEVREYIENLKENDIELDEYINKNNYNIWKAQIKNNTWEIILLKKTNTLDEIEDIEFIYKSSIIEMLPMADSYYIINQHYELPLPIQTPMDQVKEYVENSKITNKELDKEKVTRNNENIDNIYENIAWKIQTKNNKWEVIFRGRFNK